MRERAALFPRWLTGLLVLGVSGYAVYALRGVFTPVLAAFLLAYALDPVVDRIEARGVRRDVAIALLLGAILGGVTLFLLLVVPGIVRDVRAFLDRLPGVVHAALDRYGPLLERYGVPVPHTTGEIVARLGEMDLELAEGAISPLATVLRFVVGGTASALGAVAGLVMIPVFAFYVLHDFDRMVASARDLLPMRRRDAVVGVVQEIDAVLGQFVRGQLTVMAALALLFAVGYGLVGVRLALPIGIAAGLLSFIPYAGAAVALGLGLLMVAFDGLGLGAALGVVGVYTAVQVLEGFVITPRVVGDKVGLSSVSVLFALMVGGEVFGFLGVLLAVPAAAVMKIFVVRGIERYKASALFLGRVEEGGAAAVAVSDSAGESESGPDSESGSDWVGHPGPEPESDLVGDSGAEPESDPVGDSGAKSEAVTLIAAGSRAESRSDPAVVPAAGAVDSAEATAGEPADPEGAHEKAPSPVEC